MSAEQPSGFEADKPLPALREDIRLLPGTRSWSGEPTWTLSDPVRNRYFQLGDRDVKLLGHWHEGTATAVIAAAARDDGIEVAIEEVEALFNFLVNAELIDTALPALRHRLTATYESRKHSLFKALLHKYLFFRIPLVRPDRFLNALYPRVRILFQPWFPKVTFALGLVGLLLMVQSWERVIGGCSWFLTPIGMLVFGLTLIGVKMLHEMGHALMCKHYGLRVPTMGIAFLVLWPVMYTDASDGWRLVSRWQRARIAAAGVITELMLACYAMLAWFILPDGVWRSVALAVATSTWVISLTVNLNPLMRFDGYYFLSDLVNIPNLQDRAFSVARWRLRRWLFGLEAPCPEHLPARLLNFMAWYAWATWIYRFFLFLGIAFLVYHLFFKVLGVFLFGVEIWWFLARPIWGEIRHWRSIAPHASLPRRGLFAAVALVLFFLLAFPWKSSVELPALLSAMRHSRVFVPADAQVVAVHARDGIVVKTGQILVELNSPELASRIRLATLEIQRIEGALATSSMDSALYQDRLVLEQQRLQATALLQALQAEQERLTVRATFDGVIRDFESHLYPGRWLARDSHLLTIVAPERVEVTAWISEGDRERLRAGSGAVFWADGSQGPQGLDLRLREVESAAVRSLDPPYLASTYDGRIPVNEAGDGTLVPLQALYRVRLDGQTVFNGKQKPLLRWRGRVVVEGERRSLLWQGVKWTLGGLIRESGL
jgi:putative peptide zinc metalloprotease protein